MHFLILHGVYMTAFFKLLNSAITIYSFLCFLRIIFTWLPELNASRAGQILSDLCDPFLNIFRRLPLRIGPLDFSAVVAFGVLMILSGIVTSLSNSHYIKIGQFLVLATATLWNIISSILNILIVFLVLRLFTTFFYTDSRNIFLNQIDYSINPFVFKIAGAIFGNRPVKFQTALIVSIIFTVIIRVGLQYLTAIICSLFAALPF